MNWYYITRWGHVHVRVFMNGGKCGDLYFRDKEFEQIRGGLSSTRTAAGMVKFIPDNSEIHHLREEENG